VSMRTELEKSELSLGQNVRLNLHVTNTAADKARPMTMVRVGLPGGLSHQDWQLKELRDKSVIAAYETAPRELIFYLSGLEPGETRRIPVELKANVPGAY